MKRYPTVQKKKAKLAPQNKAKWGRQQPRKTTMKSEGPPEINPTTAKQRHNCTREAS
jgi:hypothetical protein